MTIIIFGATGGIGREAVIYALKKGFSVKATQSEKIMY